MAMKKGSFVLSLDTELAWGSFGRDKVWTRRRYFEGCRDVIRALLKLLEEYGISATWGIIGHLFLSSCSPVNGMIHPEIIRPHYSWFHGDWFRYDPCSNIGDEPIWYGKDIVDAIRSCKVPQEIGCHTFSHVIVDDPGCSEACFDSELKLCRQLATNLGLELKSFVYPHNKDKYQEILSANRFIAYRGKEPYWYARFPELVQKIAYVIDSFMFFVPPPIVQPQKRHCWNISGSYFYGHCAGVSKLLPVSFRVSKIKRGINKAAAQFQVFHLWFHPFNLATDSPRLLGGLEEVFRHVDCLRKEERIENLTMGALAERLEVEACLE